MSEQRPVALGIQTPEQLGAGQGGLFGGGANPLAPIESIARIQNQMLQYQSGQQVLQARGQAAALASQYTDPTERAMALQRSGLGAWVPEYERVVTDSAEAMNRIGNINRQMMNDNTDRALKLMANVRNDPAHGSELWDADVNYFAGTLPDAQRGQFLSRFADLKKSVFDNSGGDPTRLQNNIDSLLYGVMDPRALSLLTGRPEPRYLEAPALPSPPGGPGLQAPPAGTVTVGQPQITPTPAPTPTPGAPTPTLGAPAPGAPPSTTANEPPPVYSDPGSLAGKSPAQPMPGTAGPGVRWGPRGELDQPVADAQKEYEERNRAYIGAQRSEGLFNEMENDIDKAQKAGGWFAPGAGAEARYEFIKGINSMLGLMGQPAIKPETVGTEESLMKLYQRTAFDFESSYMGHQRVAAETLRRASMTVPGIENTYLGAKMMLESLRAGNQRVLDQRKYDLQYLSDNKNYLGSPENFEAQYPSTLYSNRALDLFGLRTGSFPNKQALSYAYQRGRITPDQYDYARQNQGRLPPP